MNWFFLTVGYSGLLPKAPGTFGTVAALIPGIALLAFFGPQTLLLATLLATLAGIKAINAYEARTQTHDDKRIVIDELAGIWLALSIAPGVLTPFTELPILENGLALQILLSFAFFRFFDIKKPSLIGRIDREARGGIGVMGDDLLAGVAAGIASAIVWQLLKASFL
jgi:phosphatidylglycerophosphatase A